MTLRKHQRWTEGKDKSDFTYSNKEIVRKNLLEISKTCSWNQWRYPWMNLMDSIARYIPVILVNISYKVRC